MEKSDKPRITGIGGIFFKSKEPNTTKDWYKKNLGLNTDQWGTNFEWYQGADPSQKGFTQWSPASPGTSHIPPNQEYMINYRVAHIEELVAQLKKSGVTILDEIETFDYGKFVHILDGDGQKVELWEPNDLEYEKLVEGRTL